LTTLCFNDTILSGKASFENTRHKHNA